MRPRCIAAWRPVQRGYDEDWLGGTFSQAVFVGNGLMAILSGFLAHTLVELLSLGPVAPFDAAHAVLLLGGLLVLATWTENTGDDSHEQKGLWHQLSTALRAIQKGMSCLALVYDLLVTRTPVSETLRRAASAAN